MFELKFWTKKTKESNLRSHSSDKWHTRQVILPLWLLEFGNWIEHFRDRNGHGSVVNPVPDATVGAPVGPRLEEGYQPAQAPPLFPNRHCCRRNRPPPLSCFFFFILAETRLAQRPHLFPFFFFFKKVAHHPAARSGTFRQHPTGEMQPIFNEKFESDSNLQTNSLITMGRWSVGHGRGHGAGAQGWRCGGADGGGVSSGLEDGPASHWERSNAREFFRRRGGCKMANGGT